MSVKEAQPELQSLFSIDASSHLAKVSAYYSRYPDHYPVELVRMALRGGATRVEVSVSPEKLEMRDNGSPVDAMVMASIARLLEPGTDPVRKEEIIASFLDGKGIGWLALFAPAPVKVEWVSRGHAPAASSRIRRDGLEMAFVPGGGDANRLSIWRRKRDWRPERELLLLHCRYAAAEILVNTEAVEKERDIVASMVSLALGSLPGMHGGRLWIPRLGKVCRLWLLHRGIIWSSIVMPSWKGYVFEAAVEADVPVDETLLGMLRKPLRKLYLWMAKNYHRYPVWARHRVDELFFDHFRLTADEELLSRFAPFRLLTPPRLLSFTDVKKMGRLYAVAAEDGGNGLPDGGRPGIFSLTVRQRDFLVNAAGIDVVFLQRQQSRARIWASLRSRFAILRRFCSNALTLFFLLLDRSPDRHAADEKEKQFIHALTFHLQRLAREQGKMQVEAVVVGWPGLVPLRRLIRREGRRFFLRRGNARLRRAMQLFRENEENMEIIAAWVEGG